MPKSDDKCIDELSLNLRIFVTQYLYALISISYPFDMKVGHYSKIEMYMVIKYIDMHTTA